MRTAKALYTKPEVLTLGSDEIVRLVGPVQGYGVSGGGGSTADLPGEILIIGGGTGEFSQR